MLSKCQLNKCFLSKFCTRLLNINQNNCLFDSDLFFRYTYYKQPEEAGNSENENKRTIVKIKSPTKNKKLKV